MNDEFYIGWEPKAATLIGRFVRVVVVLLIIATTGLALTFATMQHTIGVSVFEWGNVKKVSGILELRPYPHLLVPRPGKADGQMGFSTYYLVAPVKFGLDSAKLATLDGRSVSLQGTLIYRDSQTMVEALPDSILATASSAALPAEKIIQLGRQTLVGEIVDSKCFFGVMNPGQLIPHRACAIRCISGGVPPVLLVRQKDCPAIYLLLVSAAGKPVNKQVLDMVAEPVEIIGEVERQGELLILHADPSTYRRVGDSSKSRL